ncbi:peptidoglycan-binding protein [Streptomyces sp. NPDC051016]|uniref:peptidoglycan-binding protein n=1 Tax=Streptomyces sp. NPDC051016 TaxID=3365638 RepID=UPI00378E2E45
MKQAIAAGTLALVSAAACLVLAPTASATQFAPKAVAAEVHCTGFTNVEITPDLKIHVPSAGTGNFNCVVARGDNNLAVLVVQESLNACYNQGIAEDRDFGGNTEQAVINAQTKINQSWGRKVLTVDGRFGPITSSYFYFQLYDYSTGHNGSHTGWCAPRP